MEGVKRLKKKTKHIRNRNGERSEREEAKTRRGAGSGKKSTRNSIKIGEICILPRNVEERRDVVERLRGNRNLDAETRKSEETVGEAESRAARVKRKKRKNESGREW